MRRVVITGMGAISPIGSSLNEILENIKNGYCSVDYIKNFDPSDLKVKIACQCKNYNPLDYFSKKDLKRLDRVNQFAMLAARNTIKDGNLNVNEYDPLKIGIVFSTGIGGLSTLEKETLKAATEGFNKISPFFIPMVIANMSASLIAIDLNIHGHVTCPVTACAGSSNAILEGYRMIKNNYCDVILAGGSEASINHLGISGFSSMKALNETLDLNRASIPFDSQRNGFVMGEGAAGILLEDLESAKKRGAKIYGEIIGAAISTDAYHITSPSPNGKYVQMAMESAIKEGNIKKEDIDYVNAHGTSTKLNDKIETLALKNTFKESISNLKVSSTKSMTGHLLGASGALEVLISTLAMNNDYIPPNINYKFFDEDCNLNIVKNKGLNEKFNIFMSNSLGFGGHNVSIIVRRFQ